MLWLALWWLQLHQHITVVITVIITIFWGHRVFLLLLAIWCGLTRKKLFSSSIWGRAVTAGAREPGSLFFTVFNYLTKLEKLHKNVHMQKKKKKKIQSKASLRLDYCLRKVLPGSYGYPSDRSGREILGNSEHFFHHCRWAKENKELKSLRMRWGNWETQIE